MIAPISLFRAGKSAISSGIGRRNLDVIAKSEDLADRADVNASG
jgi:hypothetical protein